MRGLKYGGLKPIWVKTYFKVFRSQAGAWEFSPDSHSEVDMVSFPGISQPAPETFPKTGSTVNTEFTIPVFGLRGQICMAKLLVLSATSTQEGGGARSEPEPQTAVSGILLSDCLWQCSWSFFGVTCALITWAGYYSKKNLYLKGKFAWLLSVSSPHVTSARYQRGAVPALQYLPKLGIKWH